MWQHSELREVYRKAGWKEAHFIITNTTTNTTSNTGGSGRSSNIGTLRNGQYNNISSTGGMMMMTPSASTNLLMSQQSQTTQLQQPSSPVNNGSIPNNNNSNTGLYHSISANNTLSRPMSTVGGTKYEDHHTVLAAQIRAAATASGTLPRPGTAGATSHPHHQLQQHQLMQVRVSCSKIL